MSSLILSRPGQLNSAGDDRALFQKIFQAEVLASFEKDNMFMGLQRVRNIRAGKAATFPYIGNIGTQYHVPGSEVLGNKINHADTTINVDGLLIASVPIANIDELMAYVDVRTEYSRELGRALKRELGSRFTRLVARAARTVGPLSNTWYPNYGSSGALNTATSAKDTDLKDASALTTAANLLGAINKAVQKLDEKQVPDEDRYIMVAPAQFYLIAGQAGSISSTASVFNSDIGGSGGLAEGAWPRYMGCSVIKTELMPQRQYSRDANGMPDTTSTRGLITSDNVGNTGGNNYNGDFRSTAALVFQKQAIGTVSLLDPMTESEYSVRHQATLMLAKYAMGHGVLRPEAACEIWGSNTLATSELPTN